MKKASCIAIFCFVILIVCAVFACKPSAPAEDESLGLSISVLNYTDDPIGVVYIDDIWAGSMSSHSGGTSFVGGYGLPSKWHSGIKVKVKWSDDALYQKDKDGLYESVVEVPPYTGKIPGIFWVAFFPKHVIKVFASSYGPGHPDFPDGLKVPEDTCKADPFCAVKYYKR